MRVAPLAATALVMVAACIAVKCGAVPVNADAAPGALETWIAQRVLDSTVEARAAALRDPLQPSPATLHEGMRLYRAHCEVCHGGATAQPSAIARGLYQKPPQFGDGSMADDPEGQTYWKIAHGVRFTGMPAFADALRPRQMWQITTFLRAMGKLPRDVALDWKDAH